MSTSFLLLLAATIYFPRFLNSFTLLVLKSCTTLTAEIEGNSSKIKHSNNDLILNALDTRLYGNTPQIRMKTQHCLFGFIHFVSAFHIMMTSILLYKKSQVHSVLIASTFRTNFRERINLTSFRWDCDVIILLALSL